MIKKTSFILPCVLIILLLISLGIQADTDTENSENGLEYRVSTYLWIANSDEPTVSKIDMTTGEELEKFYVGPHAESEANYIAVDKHANSWLINEYDGLLLKIHIDENIREESIEQMQDNSDILEWGEDDRVEVIKDFATDFIPKTLAVDKNNIIWVGLTGINSNKIMGFDSAGNVINEGIEISIQAYNSVIDNSNNLWLIEENSNQLVKVNLEEGEYKEYFSNNNLHNIAVDNNNYLWFINESANELYKFDVEEEKFTFLLFYNGLFKDIVIDSMNNVWAICESGTILKINENGKVLDTIKINDEIYPESIIIDFDNDFWVIDKTLDSVFRIDSNANIMANIKIGSNPSVWGDMNSYILWNIVSDSPSVIVEQSVDKDFVYPKESDIQASFNIKGLGEVFTRQKPMDLIFLVDVSGSMRGAPIRNVRIASEEIVNLLGSRDRAAIIPFNSSANVLQEFTYDKNDLIEQINRLSAGGGTRIDRGIAESIRHYEDYGREDSLKVVMLLSDGISSAAPAINQAYEAADNNILIYSLGIGSGVDQELLAEISEITGGIYRFSPTADQINEFMEELGRDIFNNSGRDVNLQINIPKMDSVVLKNIEPEPLDTVYQDDGSIILKYNYETFPMQTEELIILDYYGYNLELGEYFLTDSTILTYRDINNEYYQKEYPALSFFVKEKPQLLAFSNQAQFEGETLYLRVGSLDRDNDFEYSVENLPEGASFSPENRILKWEIDFGKAGIYEDIEFKVSDGLYEDTQNISITIFERNRSPELDRIGFKKVVEGEKLEFIINAEDPDGDELKFSAGNLPLGASFDPKLRLFSWEPEYGQAGFYPNVGFYVTDGKLMDSEKVFIWVEMGDNIPPISRIHLTGEKWSDDWFKSSVIVTITAEDNPGGTGVSDIYYKVEGDEDYQLYEGPFEIDKDGITEVWAFAIDNAGNEEIPHKKDVKISKPWTVMPFALLCQEFENNGEVRIDTVFSNGRVLLNGNLAFDYLGTAKDSIERYGEVVINDLELNAIEKILPIPDWDALKEATILSPETVLINTDDLSNMRFENDLMIFGNTHIRGLLVVEGDLYIYDDIIFENIGIFCTGNIIISGNIKLDGFIYAGKGLTIYGQPDFNGAIVVDGKVHASGNIQNNDIDLEDFLYWLKRVDYSY
ncbi:VWA domain-containing protein [Natronospora cellulosivora (SeqCode)]